jgi:hypothetical protein
LLIYKTIANKLHNFLDLDLEEHEWRRYLVLLGCKTVEIDNATDQGIREALRASIATAKLKSSSPTL